MYESQIKIYEQQYYKQIDKQLEDIVLSAVHKVHVDVDREELIKALEYDRGQYEKGYQDAMESIVQCKDCKYARKSEDVFEFDGETSLYECSYSSMANRGYEYCSWGKRKVN